MRSLLPTGLTFKPILECLAKKQVHVTYLTSAENDPVFSAGLNEYVRAKFIGKGQTATLL